MSREFTSIDNKHKITIHIIENVSYIEITLIQHQFFKTFLLLFKQVIEYLTKNNVIFIKQVILKNEEYMFSNIYDSIQINQDELLLTFKLKDYPASFYTALGLNKKA